MLTLAAIKPVTTNTVQQAAEVPLAMQSADSLTPAPRPHNVYAESACSSCRMTTVSYRTR